MNAVADNAPHILVVDDDSRIRDLLARYLADNGYRVSASADAADARRKLAGLAFDLLVVDVMMPGETGTDFVRSLRDDDQTVPVLMLTALGETEARITGFEAGADDYLPKPFDPRELLMRINAVLKRSGADRREPVETVTFGPFRYEVRTAELRRAGAPVHLTDREREILSTFAKAGGKVVPRETLASADDANERTVDVQMTRLRRKIEDDPGNPIWLQTVRGVGYRLHLE